MVDTGRTPEEEKWMENDAGKPYSKHLCLLNDISVYLGVSWPADFNRSRLEKLALAAKKANSWVNITTIQLLERKSNSYSSINGHASRARYLKGRILNVLDEGIHICNNGKIALARWSDILNFNIWFYSNSTREEFLKAHSSLFAPVIHSEASV